MILSVIAKEAAARRGEVSWPRSNQDLYVGFPYFRTFQFSSYLFYLLGAYQKQDQARQRGDSRVKNTTGVPAQEITGVVKSRVP